MFERQKSYIESLVKSAKLEHMGVTFNLSRGPFAYVYRGEKVIEGSFTNGIDFLFDGTDFCIPLYDSHGIPTSKLMYFDVYGVVLLKDNSIYRAYIGDKFEIYTVEDYISFYNRSDSKLLQSLLENYGVFLHLKDTNGKIQSI